jgi:hypothetical protein
MNQRGVTMRGIFAGGRQERDEATTYRAHADKLRDRWPRTGALLEQIAASYEADARREDNDSERSVRE